jgi:hypothetical protein
VHSVCQAWGRAARTGEDSVTHLDNGNGLDTDDPDETAWSTYRLREKLAVQAHIWQAARRTGQGSVWERVLEIRFGTLEILAMRQGALPRPAPTVS